MVLKEKSTWVIQENECEVCSIEKALDAIGGKWSFLVIRELFHEAKRYGELKRSIQRISPKSLAATLRHLEDNGIIRRTVYPTTPPMVEYALTEKGNELRPAIYAMKAWGQHWESKTESSPC